MKQILTSLVSGQTLERETTHQVMLRIANGECSDIQITAFLAAMQLRGVTVDELLGMRDGLLETGIPVDLSAYEPLDIVGTGGDGKNTFNISTTSCFVVAGAGIKVAKHGAYAATCVSGASNCIEGLGVKLNTDAGQHQRNLEKCGFTYEGTLRQCSSLFNGKILDNLCYSMTASEYRKLKAETDIFHLNP